MDVVKLLEGISTDLPSLLTESLTGIYLYGSLTQDAFNPATSDIDCITVTQQELTDRQFKDLENCFAGMARANPWTVRLQMTFLIRDQLLTMDSLAALYQFGKLNRCGSDGNPIIWVNVLESGLALVGAPPETFVPEITRETVVAALKREAVYLREEICDKPDSEWRDAPKYRAYAVLTLCRILYTFREGKVVSKPRAAEWAIKTLGDEWSDQVLNALSYDGIRTSKEIPLGSIRRYIDFVDDALHGSHSDRELNGICRE